MSKSNAKYENLQIGASFIDAGAQDCVDPMCKRMKHELRHPRGQTFHNITSGPNRSSRTMLRYVLPCDIGFYQLRDHKHEQSLKTGARRSQIG